MSESRVAKNPVALPSDVEAKILPTEITVKGPLGALTLSLCGNVSIVEVDKALQFSGRNKSKHARAMSGTVRALVNNMVMGVSKGFVRKLTLVGVGYRAQAQGDKVNLTLGFSHPVEHIMPAGVKVETPSQTEIVLTGIDKQRLGQTAAEIRAYRSPEPYKGKGVRYADEKVILKETKKK